MELANKRAQPSFAYVLNTIVEPIVKFIQMLALIILVPMVAHAHHQKLVPRTLAPALKVTPAPNVNYSILVLTISA